MPRIIITTNSDPEQIVYSERVMPNDLESKHSATQLLQRIGWAVEDAHDAEQRRRGT